MKKHLDLVIGVPSGSDWKAEFGMRLVFMSAYLSQRVPGYSSQNFRVHNVRGSILPGNRQKIVDYALHENATHVLFLDSDMVFPKDTAHRLLAHDKDVVACNCAVKRFPSCPTARQFSAGDVKGVPYYTTPDSPELERVWRVGTGVMLIKTSVLKKISKPHFQVLWEPRVQEYTGEDWYLCQKFEKHGVQVWVDNKLSLEIGHIGDLVFEHDLVQLDQTVDQMREIA